MSALRLNPPGKKPVLIPLGHDEPVTNPEFERRNAVMRIALTDRLAGLPTRRAA